MFLTSIKVFDKSWGPWYLDPDMQLRHKSKNLTHYRVNMAEINTTADFLTQIFVNATTLLEVDGSLKDLVFLLIAVKDILKYSGVEIRTNSNFDGFKAAKYYYKCVVNKRKVPNYLRLLVFERDKFRCVYCGASASEGTVLNVDHIIPVSKGGSNDTTNLQTLCRDCNNGKADRIMSIDAPSPF